MLPFRQISRHLDHQQHRILSAPPPPISHRHQHPRLRNQRHRLDSRPGRTMVAVGQHQRRCPPHRMNHASPAATRALIQSVTLSRLARISHRHWRQLRQQHSPARHHSRQLLFRPRHPGHNTADCDGQRQPTFCGAEQRHRSVILIISPAAAAPAPASVNAPIMTYGKRAMAAPLAASPTPACPT